jgi:osmoprotectant transport system permease protein
VGLLQTVPSLALLAVLIALTGRIGIAPAIAALFLYALLPIVHNTASGLADIPGHLRETAQALGISQGARLRLIELPLAARSILAGIKTSAVINVGTATIAAFVGAGGYGERIVAGLAVNDSAMLLAGAVPAAMTALALQWGFDVLERWIIPAGLQPNWGQEAD